MLANEQMMDQYDEWQHELEEVAFEGMLWEDEEIQYWGAYL